MTESEIKAVLHICHHCGTPTIGAFYTKDLGKTIRIKMCQDCWDYIGSPASQQEGATMKNRIEMETALLAKENE